MTNQTAVADQNKQAVVLPDAETMVERFMAWYKRKYNHYPNKPELMLYHDFLQVKIEEDQE